MHRLLLIITSLLISLAGFAQTTQSDSIQAARKAKIEKARAAAREKAESLASERAKIEAEKKKNDEDADRKAKQQKERQEKEKQIAADQKEKAKAEGKKVEKDENLNKAKKEKESRKEKDREKEKAEKEKAAKAKDAPKSAAPQDTAKKLSIRERNMADTAIAKSKYGPATFKWRGNVGATVTWSDYSSRKDKIGFESWGFVINGGAGYRFNHVVYAGLLLDLEFIELLAFSPMVDLVVAAPTPVAPFVELTAGPYVSYDENRKWVFQPRFGLSYRGKKEKIMRFGFGLRMYDDAFDSDSFKPQYAASYTVEF